VARNTFRNQNTKNARGSDHFWTIRCRSAWQMKELLILLQMSETRGFCNNFQNNGKDEIFKEDLQRSIFRDRRSTKDMFIRDIRRSRHLFPARCCILEHQICRFAKIILRNRYNISYNLVRNYQRYTQFSISY
jgi:hypothetical protein